MGNQGAFLLGKASDAAERAPGLSRGPRLDPREGIAATTLYDQVKAFFTVCASVLRGQRDAKGGERLAKASTHRCALRKCSICCETKNSTYIMRLWHSTITNKLRRRRVGPTWMVPYSPQSTCAASVERWQQCVAANS